MAVLPADPSRPTVPNPRPVIVGISGASGSILARATVEELLRRDVPTIVVCTNGARLVWQEELAVPFTETLSEWREHPRFTYYQLGDLRASIASGTYPTAGMVIVPCSMNSIAAIFPRPRQQPATARRRRLPQGAGASWSWCLGKPLCTAPTWRIC